jgi:hypothetical protein
VTWSWTRRHFEGDPDLFECLVFTSDYDDLDQNTHIEPISDDDSDFLTGCLARLGHNSRSLLADLDNKSPCFREGQFQIDVILFGGHEIGRYVPGF